MRGSCPVCGIEDDACYGRGCFRGAIHVDPEKRVIDIINVHIAAVCRNCPSGMLWEGENASNVRATAIAPKPQPTKMRGVKKADSRADVFFMGFFLLKGYGLDHDQFEFGKSTENIRRGCRRIPTPRQTRPARLYGGTRGGSTPLVSSCFDPARLCSKFEGRSRKLDRPAQNEQPLYQQNLPSRYEKRWLSHGKRSETRKWMMMMMMMMRLKVFRRRSRQR